MFSDGVSGRCLAAAFRSGLAARSPFLVQRSTALVFPLAFLTQVRNVNHKFSLNSELTNSFGEGVPAIRRRTGSWGKDSEGEIYASLSLPCRPPAASCGPGPPPASDNPEAWVWPDVHVQHALWLSPPTLKPNSKL